MQAAAYQTEVAAREEAFNELRTVVAETHAVEGCKYRGVDFGDGAGVQVFETQDEAISALVNARVKASKRFT
jgi:hypothetical protein